MKNSPMRNGFLVCGLIVVWMSYQSVAARIDQAQSDADSASSIAYDAESKADSAREEADNANERLDRIGVWGRY
jgi:Alanine-zipper, major outer membrane lipoprotein